MGPFSWASPDRARSPWRSSRSSTRAKRSCWPRSTHSGRDRSRADRESSRMPLCTGSCQICRRCCRGATIRSSWPATSTASSARTSRAMGRTGPRAARVCSVAWATLACDSLGPRLRTATRPIHGHPVFRLTQERPHVCHEPRGSNHPTRLLLRQRRPGRSRHGLRSQRHRRLGPVGPLPAGDRNRTTS